MSDLSTDLAKLALGTQEEQRAVSGVPLCREVHELLALVLLWDPALRPYQLGTL